MIFSFITTDWRSMQCLSTRTKEMHFLCDEYYIWVEWQDLFENENEEIVERDSEIVMNINENYRHSAQNWWCFEIHAEEMKKEVWFFWKVTTLIERNWRNNDDSENNESEMKWKHYIKLWQQWGQITTIYIVLNNNYNILLVSMQNRNFSVLWLHKDMNNNLIVYIEFY